ncbi:MAG TPA: prolyl oligopeptidase family serine peptidase [Gemmatimonadaceae bacterium]|nr:prolyl oligopeptidase family serine peptidase [Gemmatimonadaceae bacterium]
MIRFPLLTGAAVLAGALASTPLAAQATARQQSATEPAAAASAPRPMSWMDMQHARSTGGGTLSPDGRWMAYVLVTPDWKEATTQSDIWLVSTERGAASARQMTFTKTKNETQPRWARDGAFLVFASNRDAAAPGGPAAGAPGASGGGGNQLYLLRPDGGEARKITEARDGVSTFAFSKDGRLLVYRSGKAGEEQLHAIQVAHLAANRDTIPAEPLTKQATGVAQWSIAPDSKRIYFTSVDTVDKDEKTRTEKRFTVKIQNAETPVASLWALDLSEKKATRLTRDSSITVSNFVVSDDARHVAFQGTAADRYKRNITEQFLNADLFLLDAGSGQVERLTKNDEVAESPPSFSPDGQWIAFSASDDMSGYNMKNSRVYLRRVSDRGGQWRKLGTGFDGDVSVGFWSRDGKTIYFGEGIRATMQLMALDVASGAVKQVTNVAGVVGVNYDEDANRYIVNYADPTTPNDFYLVSSIDKVANRAAWTRLTDVNPQLRGLALGREEEITWTSRDGKQVGGILVRPVGWQPGTRYPLIVAIHGGPAAADLLQFNGGYGAQVYAGAGYAVLKPNYRGSTNYGEAHKTGIVGNYFAPGYDDIMSGVDHLIAQGIVDSTRMGVLGWSAGGHWSNWILTHTDRFKAISSGAGTSNWISMYAQSDVQRNRQFYLGDKLPYENFDAYWAQSPLKYIQNAKTPTMIHVVEGDPRVPSPQSVELHMALKKLGVPTELYLYPGQSHGIPDARNRLLKSTAEMAWMDHYVRGTGRKFAWRDVLKTLEEEKPAMAPTLAGEKK